MHPISFSFSTFPVVLQCFFIFLLPGCENQQNQNKNTDDFSSLAEAYESYFKIGVALNRHQVSGDIPQAESLIEQHFNSMTPENLLKWERVHPEPGQFNFEPADTYVNFGEQNDMFIIGHTLVWHNQVPDWIFKDETGEEIEREALLQQMKAHIDSVAGRYKDQIDGWDVVNEALLDDGRPRQTPWYQIIGEDYLEKAFQYAHEAAPQAELYYNDYNLWIPDKRDAAIELVRKLQENETPIHGIGMQSHLQIDTPAIEMIEESILAFSGLGLKVMITELDVDVLPGRDQVNIDEHDHSDLHAELNPFTAGLPDSMQEQLTNRYAELFELFKKQSDKIDRVTFWGLNDNQSWLNNFPIRGRTNYPLLFDRNYQPKPVVEELIKIASD